MTENFLIHLSKYKRIDYGRITGKESEFVLWGDYQYYEREYSIELSEYFFTHVSVGFNAKREIKNLLKRGKLGKPKSRLWEDQNNYSREQIKNMNRFYHGRK